MLLRVLGTAAGGGLPQWNCACPGCAGARAHPQRRRRHASLAVRTEAGRWYLVNATPDLGDQIEDSPELHPGPGPRQTPVAGVLLTDAELDHTLGLARLREARSVEVLATAPVLTALLDRLSLGEVLGPYTGIEWGELTTLPRPLGELTVSAVPVSAKRPRYAAGTGTDEPMWSVALRLHDPTARKTLLYAPALAVWSEEFQEACEGADCVLVDGTFWDDDEPLRAGFSTRTATGMGHLPIAGPGGTAHRLSALRARCLYTHLNNTNPLGDPGAAEHEQLAAWGLEAATDRMVIEL
ncbi:pyrroloquinoline quinone biosynthesis protein PqqB [Streptomyces sp. uw30]|uniref:pyrroloquinoline quinone biosynthesis protein PqqB n=1 Tax=Streptomyces sp. uw30 TaxID=1828179 RepID=UPI0011CE32C5|nr:pyrroloquinoline quinone biosynthesis protein PqqB [Streptomyces sp. uw30]TXS49970.1 pyrroloquinoline quinone biosynthesis protein PqqB [Streptomyces sp. uw30]